MDTFSYTDFIPFSQKENFNTMINYKCPFIGFKYDNPREDDVDVLCEFITFENDTREK